MGPVSTVIGILILIYKQWLELIDLAKRISLCSKELFADENNEAVKSRQIHYAAAAIDRLLDREQVGDEEASVDDEEEDGFLKAFKLLRDKYEVQKVEEFNALGKGKRSRKHTVSVEDDDLAGLPYRKRNRVDSTEPIPLMEGEGKSFRVLGFNQSQRAAFVQILMRFGVGDYDWKEFAPRLKQKHGYGRWKAIVDDKDLRIQEVICQELNLPFINLPVPGQAGSQVQYVVNASNAESSGNQTRGNDSGNGIGGEIGQGVADPVNQTQLYPDSSILYHFRDMQRRQVEYVKKRVLLLEKGITAEFAKEQMRELNANEVPSEEPQIGQRVADMPSSNAREIPSRTLSPVVGTGAGSESTAVRSTSPPNQQSADGAEVEMEDTPNDSEAMKPATANDDVMMEEAGNEGHVG
ncbi:HXXXD-type acyl-transferase family protein [Hibiscus syriacus]|uniref:HXXXD-type acyl-transferase family protein n=1 Tax=Hibiscus syriacus TaxID=106335 RepID=A0A6A2Z7C0_HIBSY|nr:HXXXD-type acyl-transferase family protein [Hibiscus syriacus]